MHGNPPWGWGGGAEGKEAKLNQVYLAQGKMLASGCNLPGVVRINRRELLHDAVETRRFLGLLGYCCQAGWGHGYGGSLHHPHRWHGKVLRLRWAWQGSHHPGHYSAIKQKHKNSIKQAVESFLYLYGSQGPWGGITWHGRRLVGREWRKSSRHQPGIQSGIRLGRW